MTCSSSISHHNRPANATAGDRPHIPVEPRAAATGVPRAAAPGLALLRLRPGTHGSAVMCRGGPRSVTSNPFRPTALTHWSNTVFAGQQNKTI